MKLSTGTHFDIGGAGDEMLGIGADLEVAEGYDTHCTQWVPDRLIDPDEGTFEAQLTDVEKAEVCDIMIERWSRLRETLRGRVTERKD